MTRIAILMLAAVLGAVASLVARAGDRLRRLGDDLAYYADLWSIPGVAEAMRRWPGKPPRWLPRAVRAACDRERP